MNYVKMPRNPWPKDPDIIAVATTVVMGETMPRSFLYARMMDLQINVRINWFPYDHLLVAIGQAQGRDPVHADLTWVQEQMRKHSRQSEHDLDDATDLMMPCDDSCGCTGPTARPVSGFIMHDPGRELSEYMASVDRLHDTKSPKFPIVNTAVLERARRQKLYQGADESARAYYCRIAAADGELPSLLSCYMDHDWPDGSVLPTDMLFPIIATHMIYRRHFRGRLLNPEPAASDHLQDGSGQSLTAVTA